MKIVIEPNQHFTKKTVYRIYIDGWGLGVDLKSYDAACRVANAISDAADTDIVAIDYSACIKDGSNV